MAERPTVVTTFKDIPADESVRDLIEKRCEHFADEFHELHRMEVSLAEDGQGFTAHGHFPCKGHDVGAQSAGGELGPAVDKLLDKIERQLRTHHDKRIFSQRRDAQKHPPKKRTPA
jgi:ribosomal subunit interface protein